MTRFLPVLALLLVAPLTGCETMIAAIDESLTEARSPTDTAPITDRTTQLAVTFGAMEVIRDCETIVEGAGDFDIRVSAVASGSSGIEVYKGKPEISEGHSTGAFGRRDFTVPAVDGQTLNITFLASEIDTAPFRGAFPDPRLNNATKTATHTYQNGQWSAPGARAITLGSGACQVRLHYDLAQVS